MSITRNSCIIRYCTVVSNRHSMWFLAPPPCYKRQSALRGYLRRVLLRKGSRRGKSSARKIWRSIRCLVCSFSCSLPSASCVYRSRSQCQLCETFGVGWGRVGGQVRDKNVSHCNSVTSVEHQLLRELCRY